ncbi:hypothetical protein [Kordia sp.]|uniref:hypothetical protein n=1 Tax=Kordia sp. TaxID=1965332 RepID=UPI003D2C0CF0
MIKKKWKVLTIETKLLLSIFGAIIVLSFIAPYIHIPLSKTSIVKVFGFRNLRSFMYASGTPYSLLVCSFLLILASKYIFESVPKIFFKICGLVFLYSSIFQFIWIFWAATDLPKSAYYSSITVLSLVPIYIINRLYNKYQIGIEKTKQTIRNLISFLYSLDKKGYVKDDRLNEYRKERTIITQETILENENS